MYINTYTRILKTYESNIILFQFKNSPNVHNYPTTTTTFITNSPTCIIFTPINQQHVSKHHQQQLNMKSFPFNKPQVHHSSFSPKTQHIHTYDFWHMNSISTHLIIQFTCTNILSTIRHEFIHPISHNHLFSKSLNWIITYEKGVEKEIMIKV